MGRTSANLAPTAEQRPPAAPPRQVAVRRRGEPWEETRGRRRTEVLALVTLAVVLGIAGLNRVVFDVWISRFDLYTFFVPWYAFLGEGLRQLSIPGWNPHLFSGTPFAADPESGWMYLPAMLIFPLTDVLTGFKALLLLHLAVAGFSAYLYARVLGLGPFAALTAALVFALGPVLQWASYCCLVLIEYAVWVPLLLLGIELAVRAGDWRGRLLPWCLTSFALSQMLAGWVGQGWLVGPILIAAYTTYRALLDPPVSPPWRVRLLVWVSTGLVTVGAGLALGAAGVLPRLDYSNESNLAGGVYSQLGGAANDKPAWTPIQLVHHLLGDDYDQRFSALGGAVIVLALLAPVIAGRRHGVPFFALLTLVSLILTLDPTPVHALFYLIPRFEELHRHDPWRLYALGIIGPAMLCGATMQELPRWRGRGRLLPVLFIPLLLVGLGAIVVRGAGEPVSWAPLIAAALTVLLLVLFVAAPATPARRTLVRLAPVAILAVIVVQPAGLELTGSWLGFPANESWEEHWRPDPVRMERLRHEIAPIDRPGGAGAFLQTQLAGLGSFRYLGYGGAGHHDGGPSTTNYMGRRLNANIHAILVNGRAMFLDLYDTQGYNPLELGRYAEFITAVNGKQQDYHLAYLLPSGIGSPLLDLLNLRYILVDDTLPADRDDRLALAERYPEVFRAEHVVVYERQPVPRHAWIVHDVRPVARGEALPRMISGGIDFSRTALVEGTPPEVAPTPAGAAESALVTHYEPDQLTVRTSSAAPGLLVLSEIYASGWQATVDGQAVAILPTNHALRGVPLPAGEHTVEMRYEPLSLRAGLVISLVASLLVAVLIVLAVWRRWSPARRPD